MSKKVVDPWTEPQSKQEVVRMANLVRLAGLSVKDARERFPNMREMCDGCAFRKGTEANQSRLVVEMIEDALIANNVFMCHHNRVRCKDGSVVLPPGEEAEMCAGYGNLLHTFYAMEQRALPQKGKS